MMVSPASISAPCPYAAEILEIDEAIQQVEVQLQELAVVYRDRACQRIRGYVLERVRETCTHQYPEDFLALFPAEQTDLMQRVQAVAGQLQEQLRRIDLQQGEDPWRVLETGLAPHFAAAQQQLDQIYQRAEIGLGATDPSLTCLRWLEMEMADPELKGLRAHLQVASARLARLQRHRREYERKQQIAAAAACWVALQSTGQLQEEDATMGPGSAGSIGM